MYFFTLYVSYLVRRVFPHIGTSDSRVRRVSPVPAEPQVSIQDRFAHFPNPKHRSIGKLVCYLLPVVVFVVLIALSILILAYPMFVYHGNPLKSYLMGLAGIVGLWYGGFTLLRGSREALVSRYHECTSDHQFASYLLSRSTREIYESYYSEYCEEVCQIEQKYKSELTAAVKFDDAGESAFAKEDALARRKTAVSGLTQELRRFRWELMKSEGKHLYLIPPDSPKSPYDSPYPS